MFLLVTCLLYTAALGRVVEEDRQQRLVIENSNSLEEIPGDSIVKLCPESRATDMLSIERIVNRPEPVLYVLINENLTTWLTLSSDLVGLLRDEEIDVFIWGTLSRDISPYSTVDYQLNITANTGDFGALNGTFYICDYLEKMHQPPDSNEPEKACPPSKGLVFIDYAAWFADWLVAPGNWSVKLDAKTPEGDRIYCLQTEFDLQCPPERDDYRCLRNVSYTLDVLSMVQR